MSKEMIALLDRQLVALGSADAFSAVRVARETVNVAASIIRDQENRIAQLELEVKQNLLSTSRRCEWLEKQLVDNPLHQHNAAPLL